MKTCWVALLLAILIGVAVFLIGAISYNGGFTQIQVIQLQRQNEELDFLLQEKQDKVEELEEIINASGTFTLSVEIR